MLNKRAIKKRKADHLIMFSKHSISCDGADEVYCRNGIPEEPMALKVYVQFLCNMSSILSLTSLYSGNLLIVCQHYLKQVTYNI